MANGDVLSVTIDGIEIVRVSAYRINFTTSPSDPKPCEIVLQGARGQLVPPEVNAWYQTAANDPTAVRSFTLILYDSSGTQIRKYFAAKGLPTGLLNQGNRYQITIKADSVQLLT